MEKSSAEQNNYYITPIYDAHIHIYTPCPVEKTVRFLEDVKTHFNYEKIMLNALPTYNIADNFVAFYCKTRIPGIYVNAGLYHLKDCDDEAYFYNQVKDFFFFDLGSLNSINQVILYILHRFYLRLKLY